jgi:hypothetical protein
VAEDNPGRGTLIVSIIALLFSGIASLFSGIALFWIQIPQNVRAPDVRVAMPPEVRITQYEQKGGSYRIRIYIQPTFANVGRSLRTEVLRPYELYVRPHRGEGCGDRFRLNGVGSWEQENFSFSYESGAKPLVVTLDNPSAAVLAFRPPGETEPEDPSFVGTKTYLMTFVAKTTTRAEPLVKTLEVKDVSRDELRKRANQKQKSGLASSGGFVAYNTDKTNTPAACPGA